MRIGRLRTWALVGVGAGWISGAAAPALAAEGILEINQTCADLSSGCFPGDVGGFPVTISQPGSYRLTSDLVSTVSAPVVSILVEFVTLDLNGFTVKGNAIQGPSTQSAILGGNRVTVRNGFVRDASSHGVLLGESSRVEDLHVVNSGGHGVGVNARSIVRAVVATANKASGLTVGFASVIEGCSANGNLAHGISLVSGTLRGSTSIGNGLTGGDFGPSVSFASNVFEANVGGDVVGGHGSGGNVCGDGSCTSDGRKRYYLTDAIHSGAPALTACTAGFHMASLWEIANPTELSYDGRLGYELADGQGVSGTYGWIRNGWFSYTAAASPALSNCAAHTSSAAGDFGTTVGLQWFATEHWSTQSVSCAAPERVWCVED